MTPAWRSADVPPHIPSLYLRGRGRRLSGAGDWQGAGSLTMSRRAVRRVPCNQTLRVQDQPWPWSAVTWGNGTDQVAGRQSLDLDNAPCVCRRPLYVWDVCPTSRPKTGSELRRRLSFVIGGALIVHAPACSVNHQSVVP